MSNLNATAVLEAPPQIEVEVAQVTPDLAQHWLGYNTNNRKVKAATVTAMARDMQEGRWVLNGDTVRFAGPKWGPTKLLDGQHRLLAVLKSQQTVPLMVVYNVPESAQSTMDAGSKRSIADNLTINGTKYASIIAAAASLAIRIEDGILNGSSGIVATPRALEFIEANSVSLARSADIASRYNVQAEVKQSVIAYTHWRFSQIDLDEATKFWRDAAEKVELAAGDPILAMTNRFAQARRARERVPAGAAVAGVFRVWNARRAGQTLGKLQLSVPTNEMPRLK